MRSSCEIRADLRFENLLLRTEAHQCLALGWKEFGTDFLRVFDGDGVELGQDFVDRYVRLAEQFHAREAVHPGRYDFHRQRDLALQLPLAHLELRLGDSFLREA